jgi:iron complex transport system substrate-binding protein
MWPDRRAFTGGLLAALAAPRVRAAGAIQDAASRNIAVPDRVARVFPAGPRHALTSAAW